MQNKNNLTNMIFNLNIALGSKAGGLTTGLFRVLQPQGNFYGYGKWIWC